MAKAACAIAKPLTLQKVLPRDPGPIASAIGSSEQLFGASRAGCKFLRMTRSSPRPRGKFRTKHN
jgi:hypothetical protein